MIAKVKQRCRSVLARVARPAFGALDHRLEQLAARLERHTTNLAIDQRNETRRIDERLTLDVAVMSEHLLGIERASRRLALGASNATSGAVGDGSLRIALPGETLVTTNNALVECYAPNGDGTWRRVSHADASTLRIVRPAV